MEELEPLLTKFLSLLFRLLVLTVRQRTLCSFVWVSRRGRGATRKTVYKIRTRRKELHPDYQSYVRYEQDCEKYYRGLHLIELKKQKAELRVIKRYEDELRRVESWWKSLDGTDFETELASLLGKRGFQVKHTGGRGDDGVDLIISAMDRTIIVQCKAHAACIGPGPVRELYGSLVHVGADKGWLVSTSDFTVGAQKFARDKEIRLLTIREILDMEDMPNDGSPAG